MSSTGEGANGAAEVARGEAGSNTSSEAGRAGGKQRREGKGEIGLGAGGRGVKGRREGGRWEQGETGGEAGKERKGDKGGMRADTR